MEAATRSSARAEVRAVAEIRRAATGDWRAVAFLLERRFPERWGRRARVAVEHSGTSRTALVEIPSDEDRMRELAEIARDIGVVPVDDDQAHESRSSWSPSRAGGRAACEAIKRWQPALATP